MDDFFWNAIGFRIDPEAYNDKPRLSGLECRRDFQRAILENEFDNHNPWMQREVPILEHIRNQWCSDHAEEFIERFEQLLVEHEIFNPEDDYAGYHPDYPEDILLNYLRPLTNQFYCFHCRRVVTAMVNDPPDLYESWCERCHGWVLLEMDPQNLNEVPEDPIDMRDVKERLIPKPEIPWPQPMDDTYENITIGGDNIVDDMCSTCLLDFNDGQPAKRLMCNHIYHDHCFTELISYVNGSKCPICRQILLTDDELYNIYLRSTQD